MNINDPAIETCLDHARAHAQIGPQDLDTIAALAERLLALARPHQTSATRAQGRRMQRMMHDPAGKRFTTAMVDQVFRPLQHRRSAQLLADLIRTHGIPRYLTLPERLALRLGSATAQLAPNLVIPAIAAHMKRGFRDVVLPAEPQRLRPHLLRRRNEGIRINLNLLGEAILGEEEAQHRIQQICDRIRDPDCAYISIKISAIYSQINLLAPDHTLDQIKQRLRQLYRTALQHNHTFINLDMEEYRDLHLTCDAFRQVLLEPEFLPLEAGIVLQAYLPEAFPIQQQLTNWARHRIQKGGAGIKIRIVKGANLEMEKVDAALHDWPQAPYPTKEDVDANYKRMVAWGCQPENAAAVRLGIASHNLFEIAYALMQRAMHRVETRIECEMLEGMANDQAQAIATIADGILLYVPIVHQHDFHSAIAYLIRRLDENTAPQNFLHDLFNLQPETPAWSKQLEAFARSFPHTPPPTTPHRTQNRNLPPQPLPQTFHNCPDTDFALPHNVAWITQLRQTAANASQPLPPIPLVIDNQEIHTKTTAPVHDPSRPGIERTHHALATAQHIHQALDAATRAQTTWAQRPIHERAALLRAIANALQTNRGSTITTMLRDGGKIIAEADVEISEAIDFATYYATSLDHPALFQHTDFTPLGTVVITPPWNFPFAIPCGGILAALMAGNAVILKPAPETVATAWELVQQIWSAGIPRDLLQFLPCPDNEIGRSLITDPRTKAVVLTGAYETGRMFQDWKPDLRLFAETSGKNALVITQTADLDLAIKDLVRSAFGNAGQKCSAASLALIEAPVYDDPKFRRQLRDAAASLHVGSAWNPATSVNPVIRPPGQALHRALTQLDPGESWLLEPRQHDDNPCLWSPGIRLDVAPDSWYRRTECFGPVLGLVRVRDLDHAIAIQNDSEFALTGGLHALDPHEINHWRDRVHVGNAYINRPITGAIVRRQPFGGWKRSCFGPGAKAGGPNYVTQFGHWTETCPANERLATARQSYADAWHHEFSREHDPTNLYCETNVFRYVPLQRVIVRTDHLSPTDLQLVALAGQTCSVPIELSLDESLPNPPDPTAFAAIHRENIETFRNRLTTTCQPFHSVRFPGADLKTRAALNQAGLQLIDAPVLANGHHELQHYLREQAISTCIHRYGNVSNSGLNYRCAQSG